MNTPLSEKNMAEISMFALGGFVIAGLCQALRITYNKNEVKELSLEPEEWSFVASDPTLVMYLKSLEEYMVNKTMRKLYYNLIKNCDKLMFAKHRHIEEKEAIYDHDLHTLVMHQQAVDRMLQLVLKFVKRKVDGVDYQHILDTTKKIQDRIAEHTRQVFQRNLST